MDMKKQPTVRDRVPTMFLRVALIGLSALVTIIVGAFLWTIFNNWNQEVPDMTYLRFPVMAALAIAAGGFYVTAVEAWKLLNYADKGKPFSKASVKALNRIQYAAYTVGAMLISLMPLVYWAAQDDDAPGLIIIGAAFAATPIVVGVFAGVLQQLIQKALDLKSENDLTV